MTRYPKSGKGRKWTTLELRSVPLTWRGDSLSDGEGLVGEVRVSSDLATSVRFKYAFKWEGKVAWHQCGSWPTVTLDVIRANRDRAREIVKTGINPNDYKKAERLDNQAKVVAVIAEAAREATQNLPFNAMFGAWIADGVARKDGNAELRRAFDKDILPTLGDKAVKEITEHDLRGVLRVMVKRGVNRMTVRQHHDLVQLFAWAEKRQPWRSLMVEGNPADLLEIEKIVPKDYNLNQERDRVLGPDEIRELRDIFDSMESKYQAASNKYEATRPLKKESQLAMWICLSTTCRIGELLMAEWQHVNLNQAKWFIPKENVKGTRGKQQDQVVLLSGFALRQFRALHKLTGTSPWCFPARNNDSHVCVKTVSKQIGDRQEQFKNRKPLANRRHDNTLVLAHGKNGEWTPHDLRRTGATMMQGLRVPLDVIDRCQGHILAGSRVRRHYLHHDYAEEKRDAWRLLGEQIEATLAPQGKRRVNKIKALPSQKARSASRKT